MTYHRLLTEDARLVILRLTAEGNGTANDSLIRRGLGYWGHRLSADKVRTEIAWLAEQGLLATTSLPDNHLHVQITERGRDVTAGTATVPGVGTPGPN